jgi:hypothetical protein
VHIPFLIAFWETIIQRKTERRRGGKMDRNKHESKRQSLLSRRGGKLIGEDIERWIGSREFQILRVTMR